MTISTTISNYIGGSFVPARSGEWGENLNPATAEVINRFPRSGAEDVSAAVDAAEQALVGEFGEWGAERRAVLLEAVATAIESRLHEFARAESQDTGKPVSLAARMDIPRACENFRFFAGAIRHQSTDCHTTGPMGGGALNYTLRRPVGIAGLITPWNLPLYLLSWKVAPALAMGNAVIAKPSELSPTTAALLAEVFEEVGAPRGVFNLVFGFGPEVGQALVEHPRVGLISFTGGTQTGKQVAVSAAPHFKKVSLELGGKNPTVVFADADFNAAVETAVRAAFTNQGEICLCGSRILIEASLYDRFEAAFVERVRGLTVGDPAEEETELGALISLAHREKVEAFVQLARDEGGRVLCGGGRPCLEGKLAKGAFLEPTVIGGLASTCRAATEEIFGPVVTLHSFTTEEEALKKANGVRYGLSASVWTRDLNRAHRFSARLETGMVWVNTWLLRDLRVPFGGTKDSGVGREGGRNSLEFYSESRNVCVKL